jgi:hypothetical protein
MDKNNNENKQQIKGFLYEEDKINQIINILNTVTVTGFNQMKGMTIVCDILSNPIPFNTDQSK